MPLPETKASASEPLRAAQIETIQRAAKERLQEAVDKINLRLRALEFAISVCGSKHEEVVPLARAIYEFLAQDTVVAVLIEHE